jgi:trehalose/maltose hydrolase-like predicted phosphorylase
MRFGATGSRRRIANSFSKQAPKSWSRLRALGRADPGEDGAYHIRQVIGPDEYHEGVDDNSYTNVMAEWNIKRGLEVLDLLERLWPEHRAALTVQLGLSESELATWREVAERMTTGFDPASGVIEQFRGFFELEPIDQRLEAGAHDVFSAPSGSVARRL